MTIVLSLKTQWDFDTCKYRTLFLLNFVKNHQPYFVSNFNLAMGGKGRIEVYWILWFYYSSKCEGNFDLWKVTSELIFLL